MKNAKSNLLLALLSVAFLADGLCFAADPARPNILFFTADDLEWDSPGVFGCPIRDITPNIDKLASQGMRFTQAYSTVAVCQPVRATMHTGMVPHRSGCEGFEPIRANIATLNEALHRGGYLISMFGKNEHYEPHQKFCIDFEWQAKEGNRNPERIRDFTKEFIALAKQKGKPFFHHVNCGDPHRPFYKGDGKGGKSGAPSRIIKLGEVPMPAFLDDIPDVREEVAQYFCLVRRLDDSVGAAMKALEESGEAENTIVIFYGGDHGMSFPFAKSNTYSQSNHGGLIVRWPKVVKPNTVEGDQMVATIDFTPTILEIVGLPALPGIDGRSFASILKGGKQEGRDHIFTCYYRTSGEKFFPMRAIRTKTDAYIWNAWSDGAASYRAENMSGLSWKAMLKAGQTNPAIKARCEFYLHRVPEEYYDDTKDIAERKNLIGDASYRTRIDELRAMLLKQMIDTQDPLAAYFPKRYDAGAMQKCREQLFDDSAESRAQRAQMKKEKKPQRKKS